MHPNNDDNVKVNANCYYNDTNTLLSSYLLWKQVQVRVLDDHHNDILVDHYSYDNDYDIHVIHDTARNNNDLEFMDDDQYHNDVIVNHHANDSDRDVRVNNNTHIKNNNKAISLNNPHT